MALRFSSTVLITSAISSLRSISTMCGRPSATLFTAVTGSPAAASAAAAPFVATSVQPTSSPRGLSGFLTLTNTFPALGSRTPAPSCDLRNASANVSPTPMTSPVDFISGPRMVSTPGNLMNGNTASLTEKYGGTTSPVMPWLASVWPTMQRAAILASALPVALDTNGTVRDARGLTSSTYTTPWPPLSFGN